MTKPKAQTLQQKMGFFDEDLSKPKHDELMIWLDSNIENIVNEITTQNDNLKQFTADCDNQLRELEAVFNERIKNYEQALSGKSNITFLFNSNQERNDPVELQKAIDQIRKKLTYIQNFKPSEIIPTKPRIKKIEKNWEFPVTTRPGYSLSNKYTVGFIDFAATFNEPKLILNGLRYELNSNNQRSLYDFEEPLTISYQPTKRSIFIEVKTDIKSIGEFMRQINHYRTYLPGDYYVLCPNEEFKSIIESQNVKFIYYK